MDDNKRAILEAVAKAEKEIRPFEDEMEGVSHEDTDDDFEKSDFGINTTAYIPLRLYEMHECEDPSVLNCPSDSGGASNARYRLTEYGWSIVDERPP